MHGHHLVKDVVLGLAILIVTLWPNLLGATASMWVVIIAAVLLVIHGLWCRRCMAMDMHGERSRSRRR